MAEEETRPQISRRKFMAWTAAMAASAGIVPLLEGCSPSTPAPTQAPAPPQAPAAPAPTKAPVVPTPATGAVATAAPAPTAASARQTGGILTMVDNNTLLNAGFPQKMPSGWSIRQSYPAIERLWDIDINGKIVPVLATDVKTDPANKAVNVTLRKGVKFHDGTDFNADAVKWNLEKAMEVKTFSASALKSVDKIDDYNVRINLAAWDITVTDMMGVSYLGMMISPTAYQKNGEEWAIKNPVGTGPFQFVSWEKDVKIAYKKFPGYWQPGKPYLDGIEISFVADPVVRLLTFRKGDADILVNTPPQDVAALEKEGYRQIRFVPYLGAPYGAVFSSADPNSPWSKLEARQAAQHALDCEALVKALLFGEGQAPTQWIYKGHWAYNPEIKGYPYNPAKAKELLAQAGFPNGFKTKYMFETMRPDHQSLGEAVARYLGQVGIDVELAPTPSAKLNEYQYSGTPWEGFIFDAPPPYPVDAGLRDRYSGDGRNFVNMLAPDDYKKAIQSAITASTFEDKQKWTREALRLMTDKYALTLMFYFNTPLNTEQKYIHDINMGVAPNNNWTPADAWKEKR